MGNAAIEVEELSKAYRIAPGRQAQVYRTFQEDFLSLPRSLWFALRRGGADGRSEHQTVWALEDVSFEVREGEVVGIIGRNGAGKSTLLKILSRITEPTRGQARIYGRVGSLLEVGTGFHPELTGRENVYLSGAILGMRRSEIARRFDDIIEFAGVERFTETPVKRYSTGMYMRLAFAVAAHLETDILVVDEVLAVGDAEFQKKCLGKMDLVASSGRTVLFVSHNMSAVRSLCKSALWLDAGRVRASGPTDLVSRCYLSSLDQTDPDAPIPPAQRLEGSGQVTILRARLVGQSGAVQNTYLIDEPMVLQLDYAVHHQIAGTFWLLVYSMENVVVLSSFQKDVSEPTPLRADGAVAVRIEDVGLMPGTYYVSAGVIDTAANVVDWVDQVVKFEVLPQYADGRPADQRLGLITRRLAWSLPA